MKFALGQSGNPNGRPRGSGHRQMLFDSLVEPHREHLVKKSVELALSGNERMLCILLERLLPAKPTGELISIHCELDGSLTDQGNKVLSLMTGGELTLAEGEALLQAISLQAKLLETDELIRRIVQLEERYVTKTKQSLNLERITK